MNLKEDFLELSRDIISNPLFFYRSEPRFNELAISKNHDCIYDFWNSNLREKSHYIYVFPSIDFYEIININKENTVIYEYSECVFQAPKCVSFHFGKTHRVPKIDIYLSNEKHFSGYIHGSPVNFTLNEGKITCLDKINHKSVGLLNFTKGVTRDAIDKAVKVNGKVIFIGDTFSWTNFAHWSLDHFSRLLLIDSYLDEGLGSYYLVFNEKPKKFHFEMLSLLGFPKKNIIFPEEKENDFLVFSEGIITTNLSYDFRHSVHKGSKFLLDLYNEFKNKHEIKAFKTGKTTKVVIERTSRGLFISKEARRFLEVNGWDFVYLENLTYPEQVATFSSASHIISPHGAGLSNLVFCQPNTKVLEVFNGNLCTHAFFTVSFFNELQYFAVEEGFQEDIDAEIEPLLVRGFLSLDTLKEWLEK